MAAKLLVLAVARLTALRLRLETICCGAHHQVFHFMFRVSISARDQEKWGLNEVLLSGC